jgi:hypothetical protein
MYVHVRAHLGNKKYFQAACLLIQSENGFSGSHGNISISP